MKIYFITREGSGLAGARNRCYGFARELNKFGVETDVLSLCNTLGAKDGERERELSLIDKIRLNYKAYRILAKEKNAIFYIQRFNYHSFAPYLGYLLKGNRIILDLDDWEMRENPKYYCNFFPSSKAHFFTKILAKSSICCIAASRYLEEFLAPFNKNVFYIPTGVDTEMFQPCSNGVEKKSLIFSWIGTFHKKEYIDNIQLALDAFAALRKNYSHIQIDIVGKGIYEDVLKRIVREYGDPNIHLKGWIAHEAMPQYLKSIDVGLFPVAHVNKFNLSKSPTKLFEYMAMGKPTISSNIGDVSEIIRDAVNGFSANSKEEFIAKMRALIENEELRTRMGRKARETVEKDYSLSIMGKRLHEIVKEINA